jgi:CTP synthase
LKTRLNMKSWNKVVEGFVKTKDSVSVVLVGKYATLADSYVSVNHALMHAAASRKVRVQISLFESEEIEKDAGILERLNMFDGIVLPQGFGSRGTEGKILAADYARREKIPFLGLCFGFQLAVVAFARYVAGLEKANTTEIDPSTPHPVIDLLPEQKTVSELGGTMRLGGHDIYIKHGSLAHSIYGTEKIRERHRHRYEVNPSYIEVLEKKGLRFSAFSDNGRRAEILELNDHPFYFATQFHPEYISRPESPEPSFVAFIDACLSSRGKRVKELEVRQSIT